MLGLADPIVLETNLRVGTGADPQVLLKWSIKLLVSTATGRSIQLQQIKGNGTAYTLCAETGCD